LKKKQLLGLIYFFIILFNAMIVTAKHTRSLSRMFRNRNMMECDHVNDTPSSTVKTINVSAPLGRFIVGVFEGVIGNNVDWYKCLPEEYFVDVPDIGRHGFVQEKFNEFSESLQNVLLRVELVVTWTCRVVAITKIVSKLFAWIFKSHPNKRKIFLEGKFTRNRGFFDRFSEMIDESNGWGREKLEKIKNKVSQINLEEIKNIADVIVDFKKKISDFLKQPMVKKVLCIGKCIYDVLKSSNELFQISTVIDTLISGALNFTGVYAVAKIIWKLICNFQKFTQLVNFAAQALRTENKAEKFFYWGKTFGLLLNLIGTTLSKKKLK
jgi:hypothetical protein